MKSAKRLPTDRMELPIQDKIRTLGEKETKNTWLSWRLTPSNKWKWKTKLIKSNSGEPENYSRQSYLAEILSKEQILRLYSSLDIREPF